VRYMGPDRREHAERAGTKSEARALYMRRKTEIAAGTWTAPLRARGTRRKRIAPCSEQQGHGCPAHAGIDPSRSSTRASVVSREKWLLP